MPFKFIFSFFALFCIVIHLSAQEGTFQTIQISNSEPSLDKVLSNYEVHKIPVNKIQQHLIANDYNNNISLNFDSKFDLEIYLYENNLIDDNYAIRTSFGDRNSTARTFEGNIKSTAEDVRLTINTDFIYGIIKYKSQEYFIEPLRYFNKNADRDLFVIYNSRDVIKDSKSKCAVTDKIKISQQQNHQEQNTPNRFVDNCYIVEMAIASAYDMYTEYSNSVVDVEDHNIGVMNNVQIDYRSEFDDNVEFKIVEQFVATTTPDPWTTSENVDTLILDFKNWGNTSGNFTVAFDVGQFWTTRDLFAKVGTTEFPSVIGYAYGAVICTSFKYHILEDNNSTAWQERVLTTHELGHNFSAIHDAAGSGFIMAPSVNNTSDWSFTSATDISNHISSRTCFYNCDVEGAPVAEFTSGGTAACIGSTIDFKDISQYGATRTWTFTGGSPASSTDAQESVTYNTAGIYDVSLTSTNAAGSSTTTKVGHIVISDIETPNCTPSGAAGSGGIYFFGLSNLTSSTSTNQIYQDLSCNEAPISLDLSATYTPAIGLGVCSPNGNLLETAKIYIDYDNNGTFSASEEVSSLSGSGCGTITNNNTLSFTTPNSPILDTLLLLRVIVDSPSISGPCHTPSSGEVEDYAVIFKSIPAGCDVVNTVTDNPASGLYEASEKVLTSGVVQVTTDAMFEAGDTICLENDFEVLGTATFSAEIVSPCANFAPTNPQSSRIQIQHAYADQNNTVVEPLLTFDLPLESNVQVFIHNKKGEVVYIPVHDTIYPKGKNKIALTKTDLEPGIYYVTVKTDHMRMNDIWVVGKE